jgi:hypothetical protein
MKLEALERAFRNACSKGGLIRILALYLLCAGWIFADEEPPASANLLSMGRMGAGAPGGWLVTGEHYAWEAESAPGPLGPGAARLLFAEPGHVEVVSPARRMRGGVAHALQFWLRSEPAGARVEVEVRDNDSEQGWGLKKEATATETWQPVTVQETLFPAIKGGYYLKFRVSSGAGTVWLDGLWLGEKETPAGPEWRPELLPAGVVLEPEAPWGLVNGQESMRVRARAAGVTESGCRLQLRAANTNGVTAELSALPLDDQGVWAGSFEIPGEVGAAYGMLRVEAVVLGPDGQPRSPSSETLLARAPDPVPGPRPESPFGVHILLQDPDLGVAAKLGYKWCRIHDASCITKWGCAEPEKGQWVWADDQVALTRNHGLSILGMLDGAPPWASGSTEGGYFSIYHAPKNIADWRNYVRAMVSHHAGAIDDWEVWNEPWDMFRFFQGGNPALYAVLLEAAFQEAKAANPKCTIVGIDTYPPLWEAAVLAMGAYPNYDILSWHRYDPNLPGRPHDAIARVAERLEAAQKPYGPPKPLMCSEGGPDVALFHGSFFSFADPSLAGDWSRGADMYARWYLSAIAAGNQRVITYSMHGRPRHGWSTHMMVEPGPLLRPMHLALSALAHFTEGARYDTRLKPAPDISAFIFRNEPATVAVLIADGDSPEDLPRPLPDGARYFDRWSNPVSAPGQASRAPIYVVAAPDEAQALLDALQPAPVPPAPTAEELPDAVLMALTRGEPPLWTLFSAQGSVVAMGTDDGTVTATRMDLRTDEALAARFKLPPEAVLAERAITPAGPFTTGRARITAGSRSWALTFSAVPDGPENGYRLLQLAVVPESGPPAEEDSKQIEAVLSRWERALAEAHTRELHGQFHDGPRNVAAATLNGEYFVFDDPEYMITMMNTAVLWGPAKKSALTLSNLTVTGNLATVTGRWDLDSLAFGSGPYAVVAALTRTGGEWKLISFCTSAGKP